MNTQDKELDNLFRSRLDDFETEPSANAWQDIDASLSANKRKRLLVPLLSVAASIIVLIATGIVFVSRYVQNVAHHPVDHSIARIDISVKKPVIIASQTTITKVDPIRTTNLVKQAAVSRSNKRQLIIGQAKSNNTIAPQRQPVNATVQQVVAAVVPDKHDVEKLQPQKVDSVLLVSNSLNKPDIKPVETTVPAIQTIAKATPQPTKKRHIHSLGDMLNTVIAAVDKRKDKVIEFTDTDDDESVITGVNLGIVAVKKQN